jgi:hypothetical protein
MEMVMEMDMETENINPFLYCKLTKRALFTALFFL